MRLVLVLIKKVYSCTLKYNHCQQLNSHYHYFVVLQKIHCTVIHSHVILDILFK